MSSNQDTTGTFKFEKEMWWNYNNIFTAVIMIEVLKYIYIYMLVSVI